MTGMQMATAPRWRASHVLTNFAAWIAALVRARRSSAQTISAWPRYAVYLTLGTAAVLAAMIWLDAAAMVAVARLPVWVNVTFNVITDFGRSGWFLIPLAVLLMLLAIVDMPWLDRWSRLVLATLVVRVGFLFVALALPGLVQTAIKHGIGRVRPSPLGPFAYEPLSWRAEFASFPSGHATTAFSVLAAFGAMFPRLRPVLWGYAILIAASRVVLSSHWPSDVVGGAVVGALGALLVRNWFAARRLGFYQTARGDVRPLPAPSRARLKGVARRLFAQ